MSHTLGEPQVAGPLAVFPVFGPDPRLAYRPFVTAIDLGAVARERDGAASVRALVVENPTDLAVLLYEGEEVLGAQQNRTFDESVLVAAGTKVEVTVSCVEAGRWDGRRHAERMQSSPQAADPDLRRTKRAAAHRAGQADQSEVWSVVGERLSHHGVASPSAAMSDIYDSRRIDLASLVREVQHMDDQVGALAAVSGRPVVLDLVSRPAAFEALLPKLAQGYALQALGAPERPVDPAEAGRFLTAALAAPRVSRRTPGMGHAVEVAAGALLGRGLEHDGELIQLSAFPAVG